MSPPADLLVASAGSSVEGRGTADVVALGALDVVRRLLDAEEHRDTMRYRRLLHTAVRETVNGAPSAEGADEATAAAARAWSLSPQGRRVVDDVHDLGSHATVRYRLFGAVPAATGAHDAGAWYGYSVYEVVDGLVVRALHQLAPAPRRDGVPAAPAPTAVPSAPAPSTAAAAGAEVVAPAPGESAATAARPWWRRAIGLLAAVVGFVLTEPLWAAPVVATTAWAGPAVGFATMLPLYGGVSFAVSLVLIRHAGGRGRPGRLECALGVEADRPGARRIRRLVQTGRAAGFVLSSVLLGSIATTWLLLQLGRREHVVRDSALSAAIFGVSFVAFYTGLASLVF